MRLTVLTTLLLAAQLACSKRDFDLVGLAPGSLGVGMVAHYAGEGESLGQLMDTSGNGHHGVLSGVSHVEGRFGSALRFQSGNFASVPNFPQATSSYTVAMWVRPVAGDACASYCTLASTEAVFVGGWEMNVKLSAAETGYHFGYPYGGDATFIYAHVDNLWVKLGVWTHLAAVLDADTMRLRLYVDGVLIDDQEAKNLIQRGSTTLYLGRWLGEQRFYVGDLDDLVMYSRPLDPAEIRALYAAPAPDPK